MRKYLLHLCFFFLYAPLFGQVFDSLFDKGNALLVVDPDSAQHYVEKLKALDLQGDALARFHWLNGSVLRLKNQPEKSLKAYELGLATATERQTEADNLMGIASIHYAQNKPEEAVQEYLEAANLYEALDNEARQSAAMSNLGMVLSGVGSDSTAKYYLHKAIMLAEKHNQVNVFLPAYINLGLIYQKEANYDSAEHYGLRCLAYSDENGMSLGVAKAASLLAEVFLKQQEYKKAHQIVVRGLEVSHELNLQASIEQLTLDEAEIFVRQQQPEACLKLLETFDLGEYSGGTQKRIHYLYYLAHEQQGNIKKALEAYKKYHEASENMVNKASFNAIADLETRYRVAQQNAEIQNLEERAAWQNTKARQSRVIIILLLVVVMLLGGLVFFYYKSKLNRQKKQLAISQQQLLRSQVNPHFIFNALTSIRSYILNDFDSKNAINYLGKFARLMRLVLNHSSREYVSLEEELEALVIYLDIQKMRFNDSFVYTLEIDAGIDADQLYIPPLMAQPFVENAIEHGFRNIDYTGEIAITITRQKKEIKFQILDNGIGFQASTHPAEYESKALAIFKKRLQGLGAQLKTKLGFVMKDLGELGGKGTQIEYTLPIYTDA